jgi:hypothetical protein
MLEKDHIEALTKDLVRLAILSNNVIIKGNFEGKISDEVHTVLQLCEAIVKEYTNE